MLCFRSMVRQGRLHCISMFFEDPLIIRRECTTSSIPCKANPNFFRLWNWAEFVRWRTYPGAVASQISSSVHSGALRLTIEAYDWRFFIRREDWGHLEQWVGEPIGASYSLSFSRQFLTMPSQNTLSLQNVDKELKSILEFSNRHNFRTTIRAWLAMILLMPPNAMRFIMHRLACGKATRYSREKETQVKIDECYKRTGTAWIHTRECMGVYLVDRPDTKLVLQTFHQSKNSSDLREQAVVEKVYSRFNWELQKGTSL